MPQNGFTSSESALKKDCVAVFSSTCVVVVALVVVVIVV